MNITFAPEGILQIDDARLAFRNFSGTRGKYCKEGEGDFAVVIPDEKTAEELIHRGWNVVTRPPREEGEEPFRFLKVKFKLDSDNLRIYLDSNGRSNLLSRECYGMLDNIDIIKADLDVRPFRWEKNGAAGISAWLNVIRITQRVDRFADRDVL